MSGENVGAHGVIGFAALCAPITENHHVIFFWILNVLVRDRQGRQFAVRTLVF